MSYSEITQNGVTVIIRNGKIYKNGINVETGKPDPSYTIASYVSVGIICTVIGYYINELVRLW